MTSFRMKIRLVAHNVCSYYVDIEYDTDLFFRFRFFQSSDSNSEYHVGLPGCDE